jgi:hypothetical protein
MQPQFDPSQPMTIGQAQQMAQAIAQQMDAVRQGSVGNIQQMQQSMEQAADRIVSDKLQVANYAETINSTLNEIWNDHPVLKVTPENEDILRYRVAQLQPATVEEAKVAFKTIAREMATGIESTFSARLQQQQAQRATLAATGTEPPGGVAPQIQAPSFKDNKGALDWNKLKEAALGIAGSR